MGSELCGYIASRGWGDVTLISSVNSPSTTLGKRRSAPTSPTGLQAPFLTGQMSPAKSQISQPPGLNSMEGRESNLTLRYSKYESLRDYGLGYRRSA